MNVNLTTIIIVALVVLAALVVIGLVVASMRKRSRADDKVRAAQLRERAEVHASGLPEAQARADEEAALAEQRRLEAERAERRAAEAHQEVAQQQAQHEDQVRAADRLDPEVDHRSEDYTPETAAAETTPTTERYDATGRTETGGHVDEVDEHGVLRNPDGSERSVPGDDGTRA